VIKRPIDSDELPINFIHLLPTNRKLESTWTITALLRHLPDAFEKLFGKATEVPRNFGGLTHLPNQELTRRERIKPQAVTPADGYMREYAATEQVIGWA